MDKRGSYILHVDGDAFFASCEVALDHTLRGKPVVTGKERGIASAMSYEAKALGIYRGMPVHEIKKLHPEVIIRMSDYRNYHIFAERMYAIVGRFSNSVEKYSIDECFAELEIDSGGEEALKNLARNLQIRLEAELGMTFSIGIAPIKVLAKVASKWKKPNGLTFISKEKISEFLRDLPIGKIWGIGPETTLLLGRLGIQTALDLTQKPFSWVKEHLHEPHQRIWYELQGIRTLDLSIEDEKPKSLQCTRSFTPATNKKDFLMSHLAKNTEDVCKKIRHEDLMAHRISFFLKTQEFRYKRKEIILQNPVQTPNEVLDKIKKTFDEIFDSKYLYRATGVTLSSLKPKSLEQNDLFGERSKSNRWEEIYAVVDTIDHKFGSQTVILGQSLKAMKTPIRKGLENEVSNQETFLKGKYKKRLYLPYLGLVE